MIRNPMRMLAEDSRGAAVIELAMVAPVIALMVIGIVDLSNSFSRKLALEQGAQRAIEKIMQTTGDASVEATLGSEVVCQVNGLNTDGTCKSSPITTANVVVTYRLECTGSGGGGGGGGAVTVQTSSDSAVFDALVCPSATDTESRYIQVAVTDKYTPMFPIHFSNFTSGDSSYHFSATAGMRTQ